MLLYVDMFYMWLYMWRKVDGEGVRNLGAGCEWRSICIVGSSEPAGADSKRT